MSKDENNLSSDQMTVKSIGLRAVCLIVGLAVVVLLTVLAVRHFTGPQRSEAASEDVITGRSFATNKDWNKLTPAEKVTKNPNNCKITRTLPKYKQQKYKQEEDVLQEVILEADGRCLPFNPYGLPNHLNKSGFDLSVMYDGLSPENFGLTNNIVKQPQAIINNNLVFSSISVVCSDGSNRNGGITPNKICRLDFIYTNNTRQKIRPYHCHIIKATRLVDTSGKAYQPTLFVINTPADWQDALSNSSHRSTGLDCGAIMAGSLGAALEPGQSRRGRIDFKLPTASQVNKAGFRDFSLCQRSGSGNCLNSKTSSGAASVELEDCRNIQIIRSNNTYCHQTVNWPDDLIGISTISLLNRPRFGDIEFRPIDIACSVESEPVHGCFFNFKLVNLGSQQTVIDRCNLFDSIAFEVSQDGQRKIIPVVDEQYWCTKEDKKLTLGDKSSNENVSATLSVYSGVTDDIKFQKIVLKDPTKVADETEYTLNIPIRKIEAFDVYTDKNEASYTVGAITVTEPFVVTCLKLSGLSNHECLIFNDDGVTVNLKPGDSQADICASLDFADRLWVSSNNQKQYSTDLQLISSDGKRYSVEELNSYCEVDYYDEEVGGYVSDGVVYYSPVLVVAIDLGDAETIKAIQIRDSLDCRKDLISLEHDCLQKAPIRDINL